MGILLEADYKGVLQGKESPLSGLRRAFSARKEGARGNPLEKEDGEGLEPGEGDGQVTYELMNRDTGEWAPPLAPQVYLVVGRLLIGPT